MLARFLVALLIALLPMPAGATAVSCHEAAPVATTHGGHHQPAQPEPEKQRPAEQLCIGCVAPATARAPVLAPPLAYPAMLDGAVPPSGIALAEAKPATPPPRLPA